MSKEIRIESVVKLYDDFRAVDQVSIHVKAGEFFTLLGPSGCGKTTLLRMIAGFNSIDEGAILFDDTEINHLPPHRRNIGMVFQNYAVFPHLTVRENVAYGLKARRIRGAELKRRVDETMALMQIDPYADRMPSALSGGQQQRVALARAIVIHPDVLLMDEPLSNLDAKLRVQMRSSIRRLQKNLGITTIYVTHDQEEALAISDRIAVMRSGKIEQVGFPEEIYTRPANRFVANFIGVSNFIDGTLVPGGVRLPGGTLLPARTGGQPGEAVTVSVRPEHAAIVAPEESGFTGVLELSTFLGDFINHEIQLDDGPLIQINEYPGQNGYRCAIGQRVGIQLREVNVFLAETGESVMRRPEEGGPT